MAALKKSSIVLLLAVMGVLSADKAAGQPAGPPSQRLGLVTCVATAVPPVVRAEGIAELVGDIVLTCQNSAIPGATTGQLINTLVTNLSVSLNVNVTNNIDFGAGADVTDAVLIINENNCTAPSAVGSVFPTDPGACAAPDARFQVPQYGRLAATNRLEWNEVSFPIPGASSTFSGGALVDAPDCGVPGACFPAISTLRITSMRGNASQLGVPDSATFPSTQITAFVSITGPTTISVTNNVLNVAVPILGLIVDNGDPIVGLQCLDDEQHTEITLREGFATAFKTIGVASFFPGNTQWESGYYAPGSNNGAGASNPTRFILRFFNIPTGVDISVPNSINNGTSVLDSDALWIRLVPNAASDGDGGSFTTGTGSTEINISGGFGFAVYEVIDANPFANEEIDVDIWVEWESDTANDSPAVGVGQVSASFAPLSTVTVASASEPEPRFVDNAGDPEDFITIVRCTTTLLFPFVTNQAGFDTGIAISNTSEDWLGTDPQDGACTIHYHGATTGGGAAPSEQTSTVIEAGDQLIFTLSGGNLAQGIEGAPEFQGYIIAVCEFQYGHGFAFITDGFGGVRALAQGYLALVIPVTPYAGRVAGVPDTVHESNGFLHLFGEALNH